MVWKYVHSWKPDGVGNPELSKKQFLHARKIWLCVNCSSLPMMGVTQVVWCCSTIMVSLIPWCCHNTTLCYSPACMLRPRLAAKQQSSRTPGPRDWVWQFSTSRPGRPGCCLPSPARRRGASRDTRITAFTSHTSWLTNQTLWRTTRTSAAALARRCGHSWY